MAVAALGAPSALSGCAGWLSHGLLGRRGGSLFDIGYGLGGTARSTFRRGSRRAQYGVVSRSTQIVRRKVPG
jgi:hypothetical protein